MSSISAFAGWLGALLSAVGNAVLRAFRAAAGGGALAVDGGEDALSIAWPYMAAPSGEGAASPEGLLGPGAERAPQAESKKTEVATASSRMNASR
jgi:hypothetical protein